MSRIMLEIGEEMSNSLAVVGSSSNTLGAFEKAKILLVRGGRFLAGVSASGAVIGGVLAVGVYGVALPVAFAMTAAGVSIDSPISLPIGITTGLAAAGAGFLLEEKVHDYATRLGSRIAGADLSVYDSGPPAAVFRGWVNTQRQKLQHG